MLQPPYALFVSLPENAALKAKLECSQQLIERIELEQQQLRTALHHAVKEVSELKNRSRVAGAEALQVPNTLCRCPAAHVAFIIVPLLNIFEF